MKKSPSPLRYYSALAAALVCIYGCAVSRPSPEYRAAAVNPVAFREIWGYLMQGEEYAVTGKEPFTDICYFAASVDSRGRLRGARSLPVLPAAFTSGPRFHLVVNILSNPSLTHFCLKKGLPVRNALIGDIAGFSRPFDGVQMDFEAVAPEDADAFLEFLAALKKRIGPGKMLSVALPPRMRKVSDAYDYGAVAAVADRIIIMAYDEHWSTSVPGPVASLAWCRSIADYAVPSVPGEKLVMGLPLYGRAWQDRQMNRALRRWQVDEIMKTRKTGKIVRDESGPYFEYEDSVKVTVFFDDNASLMKKMRLYRSAGVRAVSFWRIGQGPRDLWRLMVREDERNTADLGESTVRKQDGMPRAAN